jgi:HD-GYP domain-containing protein (c-di-GMP phosphodiesterase class II)
MSSDPRSGAPSPGPEGPRTSEFELSLAAVVRGRGASLIEALERHLPGSREHAEATASYAFAGAAELELGRSGAEAVREVAKLHEVGKVYIPNAILGRPPVPLSDEERRLLDSQFAKGAELARGAGIPDQACDWILATGERFDGRGSRGMAGEGIPIQARIIRAACLCDSVLAAPASAPSGASPQERRSRAVEELRAGAAKELDPRVVDALAGVLERAGA